MVRYDLGYMAAVWVEILLYAIYACLLVYSIPLMYKKRSSRRTGGRSGSIFFTITVLMFIVATFHLFIQLYRYLRAFVLGLDPSSFRSYMRNPQRWDTEAIYISILAMSWLGDGLLIYRCYLIWNSNVRIVVLPIVLQLFAIVVNTINLIRFQHPSFVSSFSRVFLGLVYPIALVRNTLTTGLITLKIWKQHKASSASGLVDRGSRVTLARLLRIVVESAMIYTLQLLVLVVLYFLKSDFQIVLQSALVPSVGLVFVLIAVRVHAIKEQPISTIPTLFARMTNNQHDTDEDVSSPEHEVAFTAVDVEKLGDVDDPESLAKPSLIAPPNRCFEGEI